MSRRAGGFRGAKPAWTTTSTPGVFGLSDVVDLKAANQWPRGPAAPTSLAGTPGDGQVALTWTAPAVTHGTITDYEVQYSADGGVTWADVITPVISITTQPSNQTAASGAATFFVTATVTLGETLSYQWQKQESVAGEFANVSGATSSSLSLSSLTSTDDNGDVYRCVVSATGGAESVTSDGATLVVLPEYAPLEFAAAFSAGGAALPAGDTTGNSYSLSGEASAASPSVLAIGGIDDSENQVWLEVMQTGTLSWTVTASSENEYDYGRLYKHSGPATFSTNINPASTPAGFTAVSGPQTGASTQSGSLAVTAGEFLVLAYAKDSSGDDGSDTVTLSAYIT